MPGAPGKRWANIPSHSYRSSGADIRNSLGMAAHVLLNAGALDLHRMLPVVHRLVWQPASEGATRAPASFPHKALRPSSHSHSTQQTLVDGVRFKAQQHTPPCGGAACARPLVDAIDGRDQRPSIAYSPGIGPHPRAKHFAHGQDAVSGDGKQPPSENPGDWAALLLSRRAILNFFLFCCF